LTLHYCSYGPHHMGALQERCLATWRRKLPHFQLREWNESNSPLHVDYCQTALARGMWSKLSNFVRLWALHEEGGVYLDTDVEVLHDLEVCLDDACFLGFQSREEIPGWVNNAVLGAEAGHPFLCECLDVTLAGYHQRAEFMLSPRVSTQVLKRHGLQHYGPQTIAGVRLYPREVFYPYSWLESFRKECLTPQTLAVHHWHHSWDAGRNPPADWPIPWS